ncbi:MAG: hypothetical protein AB7D03_01985 [Thiomicrospira sp.]
MKPVLYINPVDGEASGLFNLDCARHLEKISPYHIDSLNLAIYKAILIPAHTDQRALVKAAVQLNAYLNQGGLIVFNGHIAYPFLDELKPFIPVPKTSLDYLMVERVIPHPIFEGVDEQDLSFRRGVSGFYGRGHNPPPAGAVVLNQLSGTQAPIDWLYQRPSGGTILMHSGNSMWMHFSDKTSAARITPQLFHWIETYSGDLK